MPRRPQDPHCSCDINIPTTMPGTPITIDASENVRLKVLENRMVPKNTSYLDKPKEFDDFKEDDYLYVSNDAGELRKFPIRNITVEKALDYTDAYSLVVEDASKPLAGVKIDSLEAGKFNRLPIRNNESFHLYIYLTEEDFGNRTTTGAFACTAETTDIEDPIDDPTAHVSAIITSAVSLGDDFESITINEHKAPIINGNIPISIKLNGTEFATNTINNKLTTEFTATINNKEIPVDTKAVAKIAVKINGKEVPMSDAEPGVIDLDVDTRIDEAVKVEEARATDAEKKNADNIAAEVSRATKVEAQLAADIRSASDDLNTVHETLTTLDQKISDEATARTQADDSLKTELKQFTTDEINKLDVNKIGQTGSYIKFIAEEDGKILPEIQAFANTEAIREATANDNAPGVLAVKAYVNAQDDIIHEKLAIDETILSQHSNRIDHFENIVPQAAGVDNKLADKDFVNSSIATSTATFFGTYNVVRDLKINVDDYAAEPNETDLQTKIQKRLPEAIALNWLHVENPVYPALKDVEFNSEDFLVVTTEVRAAIDYFKANRYTNLDYVFVAISESTDKPDNINHYERYKFVKSEFSLTGWYYEYCLNNSGFTSDQWKAINSGVTDEIRENAVNDHNLIREYQADGSILTKDAAGNTVWEPLVKVIPCIEESEASNTMAPTAKAVVDYVEQHFVDHLDSNIEADDGSYFNHIEITNGKLDNAMSTRKPFEDHIGEDNKNSVIAPQTKAVKDYVDNSISALDGSIAVTDGYYLKKIVIEDGVLQPIGANESNSQIVAFDDRSKLEENIATATNVPSTLAVLEKFNSNGFIVCDEADKMLQYRTKRYNNCYIKYTGVEEAGYVPGDIYLVTATSDRDPDDWNVINKNFNANRDTLQNDYRTLISNDVTGYGKIDLNIKDTLLRLGNRTSGATIAAGLASKTIAKCTDTAHGSSYDKYLVDEDVSLTSRWNTTSNTKGNFAHIDPNGDPKWVYDTYNAEGELLGIAVNAGTGAASVASMSANENAVDSYTDNAAADTNFDQIRYVNYGIHTLTFDTDTVSAEFKADVRAYALGRLDKVDNDSLETANQNNSIASLWIRYRNTHGQEVYQRIIKASTKLTFTGNGWIQSKSNNAVILAHKKNGSEDTIELPLADVKVSDDNTKSIDIIESVEAYKLLEGYTAGVNAHNALYYYAFSAFTNLQVLAKNKTAQIERLTMKPSEIESKLDSAVSSCNVRINSLETTVNGSDGIDGIVAKIPTQASAANQLADKAFVNSSIQNMAAFYVTAKSGNEYVPFNSVAELRDSTTKIYIDRTEVTKVGKNDYCIVLADETKQGGLYEAPTTRYIYTKTNTEDYDPQAWEFQYIINNTGLTSDQVKALDSGITAEKVAQIHDIPKEYLVAASTADDKLTITTNKNDTIEFEGGKINTISVNGGAKIYPTDKNIDIKIPDAPVQSISVDSVEIAPSELDGNVNIVLADKYINKTEVSTPTVDDIKSRVGSEIGNVIAVTEATREVEVYTEFID